MTANDFTSKPHVSCNGCYFNQPKNFIGCLKVENLYLLCDLYKTFGACHKKAIIYILKPKN